ncbi:hypothetical protein DF268_35925 [Streptomyces sp. V2]|uniref:hypothetical protein n=1 Tax=Streptomyces sp. V2 TaxID=1424099 RepID=UPI000D66CB08|nr:hypothetical protein [Streptomyces sp. V2]PWG08762.1 hypothetical protein DF268_35925 [Streptomyces sp. V2]
MNSCPTGTWCPAHPDLPGVLALIGLVLLAGAAVCLALALATAIRAAARRTRTPTPAADTAPPITIDDVPHLVVVAAALDDWWITTDPVQPFDSHSVAAHVELYLLSSGYHTVPNTARQHRS